MSGAVLRGGGGLGYREKERERVDEVEQTRLFWTMGNVFPVEAAAPD